VTEYTQPLTTCERCRHWLPHDCDADSEYWPDDGDACAEFEREPGVDG